MNIFSDKAFLPEGVLHAPMLYPFWGHVPVFDDPALEAHRFDGYVERGRDLFRLTGLEEARAAVLPFEEWIDWRQYCVWVEASEVARVAEKVAEFHEGLSDEEFRDRQRACRQLWLDWLSPLGFFRNFRRYFD